MTSLTTTTHYRRPSASTFGITPFFGFIRRKWQDYWIMRSIEAIPYDVMKDVGFPAAERQNEM